MKHQMVATTLSILTVIPLSVSLWLYVEISTGAAPDPVFGFLSGLLIGMASGWFWHVVFDATYGGDE